MTMTEGPLPEGPMGAAPDDLDLALLRANVAPYGVLVAARRIRPGDEAAFADPRPGARVEVRRASGAARIAARRLLDELGADREAALPRSPSGAPLWPPGVVGSLAHDNSFGLAAAARRGRLVGLGVDVEPAEPLPREIVEMVLSPSEQRETKNDGVSQRLVFVAKEAVYKAVNPIDGLWLDFSDIEIRLGDQTATLRNGRRLRVIPFAGERLIAVALAEASGMRPLTADRAIRGS
jgi:4'-phosphopantetheinyl transferase EntD